ncbi:MAG: isoquinoline 1-oxidoreductase, partial [Dehalococcoidia bacterium]|nr:isoquinoline 1-oxidoreductase [Dehalococcoidia bacterium]
MTQTSRKAEPVLRILGEVAIGFPPPPNTYRSVAYNNTSPNTNQAVWLEVHGNGTATAYTGKVEYGQNIRTGLAMEVADELGLPLSSVCMVMGDTDLTPWDMGTFGSQSTARVGLQLRKAAATARQTLLELASNRLDVPASQLVSTNGRVESQNDPRRSVTWADLLGQQEMMRSINDSVALKEQKEFTVMGKAATRIDAVDRVTGKMKYTQDIILPGMLFARVLRPPSRGAKLLSADTSVAKMMPGVAQVVHEGDLVAVLADNEEQAEAALKLIRAKWEEIPNQPSQIKVPEILQETGREFYTTQETGSLKDGFKAASGVLEETYYIPYVTHAPMEPRASVAKWDGDHLTVWAGSQRPFGLRSDLAKAFDMDESRVQIMTPEVGGAFGGKSVYVLALESAKLARAAKRPVRVAYNRAEDMSMTHSRPAALIQIKSGFKTDGTIVAWDFKAIHAGFTPMIGRRETPTPYNIPNVFVSVGCADSPIDTGAYRSLGAAVNNFAREVHMDEIAEQVGKDPLELRLQNMANPRWRRVLTEAAKRFGWSGGKPPTKRGYGIAIGPDVGSYMAECVEVEVQGKEVKVKRVTGVLDCGLVVNPEGAKNQVEGGIVQGLGS